MSAGLAPVQVFAKAVNLQRNYLWAVHLPGTYPGSSSQAGQLVQNVSFGPYAISALEMRWGAFVKKFGDVPSIRTLTLTVLEDEYGTAYSYFSSWRQSHITDGGFYNVKNQYVRDVEIALYSKNKQNSLLFTAKNCWPSVMPSLRLNYDEDSITKYDVELATDGIICQAAAGYSAAGVSPTTGGAANGGQLSAANVDPRGVAAAANGAVVQGGAGGVKASPWIVVPGMGIVGNQWNNMALMNAVSAANEKTSYGSKTPYYL